LRVFNRRATPMNKDRNPSALICVYLLTSAVKKNIQKILLFSAENFIFVKERAEIFS